jgi:adenosylhomocysteine nucleosidase
MKILIIGAMQEEITFLLSKLKQVTVKEVNNFTFYLGQLHQKEVVIVKSGIGKVMSGVLMATAVNHFPDIDKVINIGVAGGYGDVQVGDVVVAQACVYGDCDVTAFSHYRYGQIPNFPYLFSADSFLYNIALTLKPKTGVICTMDRFVSQADFANHLVKTYFSDLDIKCFDMESAAFAQSAHFYQLGFIAIRAISDLVCSQKQEDSYDNNLEKACLNSNLFLLQILEKI